MAIYQCYLLKVFESSRLSCKWQEQQLLESFQHWPGWCRAESLPSCSDTPDPACCVATCARLRTCGGGAGGVSALLGFEPSVARSSLLPLCGPGAGGLIRRPAALTRAKRVIVGVFPSGGGGMPASRPCRSCRWSGRAGCPPLRPGGARLQACTCI